MAQVVVGGVVGIAGVLLGLWIQEWFASIRRRRVGRGAVVEMIGNVDAAIANTVLLTDGAPRDPGLERLLEVPALARRFADLAEVISIDELAMAARVATEGPIHLRTHDEAVRQGNDPQAALGEVVNELGRVRRMMFARLRLFVPWWWRWLHWREWARLRRELDDVLEEDRRHREEIQFRAAERGLEWEP